MTDLRRSMAFVGVSVLLVVFVVSIGCARLKKDSAGVEQTEAEVIEKTEEPEPLYYDFGDVLVPIELKVDKKKSFVYHAPGFTAGILALSGRTELNSLIRFFENNMAKDNWHLVSSFKSPRTIMFFNKPNRSCIINITEKRLKTEVEIWVAPNLEDDTQSTLLK
jgi:hypothetical protein